MNKTTETVLIVATLVGAGAAIYLAYQAKLAATAAGRTTAPVAANQPQLDYASAIETLFAQLWPSQGGTPESDGNQG